ncbi:hypothetical protein CGRA01v4_15128 [Colletotrichum graminicola]|uniref:Uncharacterized protein n=1 Tax=Colletotrichum graminicola (strain M1.001 / M2 / FGSC 10212) TaxID=645133 RepID=E3QYY6_COLGM|nr:uncharacterized protein GLRG_11218 [Colletotrichum graminicola M1.001]EFQ36074.1 hypothetical protein GLRG_11218 [Colletotrichum graminicola M1.001]WDK23835.1 hypothetical protein CGRA01v4_15128 [Colletotrichum graminicola]
MAARNTGRDPSNGDSSYEHPSFYRLSLSFLFSRPTPQRHDISLCFHDEWLRRDTTTTSSSSSPSSYTLHFHRPGHVSLCSILDTDGLDDDHNPDHPDRCTGQSLCVASIHVPPPSIYSAPDMILIPGHTPSPRQNLPPLITLRLLLIVLLLTLIFFSILVPLGPSFLYKNPQYHHFHHLFTKSPTRLINTNQMLSYYELLLHRLFPLKLLHHDAPAAAGFPSNSSSSRCAIWWPPQQILFYSDTVGELSSLASYGPTTTTTRQAFVKLATQAKEAASLIHSFAANDDLELESDLLLLLIDIEEMASNESTSTSSSSSSSSSSPPLSPKASAEALASVFLAAFEPSQQWLTALEEQLTMLEQHLHQTQLLEKIALNNLLEGGVAIAEGKTTWWSEDVAFYVKRLQGEMIPRRDIVRGLVNEALLGVQTAQETMAASIQRLEQVAAAAAMGKRLGWDFSEPRVLMRQVSQVIRRTRESRAQVALWDSRMGASGLQQMAVDTPLERRLRSMDRRAKTKWEWVARIWPLGAGREEDEEEGDVVDEKAQKEEAFAQERVLDEGTGATTPSCTHSEWLFAASSTRLVSTTATRRTGPRS